MQTKEYNNNSSVALNIDINVESSSLKATTHAPTIQNNTQRYGLFSSSGLDEPKEVSLCQSDHERTTIANPFFNAQTQIQTDEELVRSLQAEENKKHIFKKPRPRGSTLECWFEDSMAELGKRLSEKATEYFGRSG